MLWQRVITALVMLPIALAVVLLAPVWLFDLVLLGVVAGLAYEYAKLCLSSHAARAAFIALTIALVAVSTQWQGASEFAYGVLLVAVALWVLVPAWFVRRQQLPGVFKAGLGLLILAGAGIALHELKDLAPDGRWVLLVFLLVWAADIGGYAFGRLFGRHKLAPGISPGKTWEGFFGGLLMVVIVGLLAGIWMVDPAPGVRWVALLLALGVISVVGDLLESLLKRQAGVKDSGNLLPGHGGVFDRLDSLLAVAPLFLFFGMELRLIA